MSTQTLQDSAYDQKSIRLADGRLFDFEMPTDVHTATVPHAPVAERPARRRGRVLVAAVLVVLLGVGALGGLAFVHVRADMAAQRRSVMELLGRAESAEQNLAELRRQEEAAAASAASLTGQLDRLKQAQFDVAGVARQVQPSVVTITTSNTLGSGFVVLSKDGTSNVITNFHVLANVWNAGGRVVTVGLRSGSVQGTIAKVSEENDLALVTVAATLPALGQAAGNPSVGDPVLVAGSPRGLAGTVTSGIVSGFRSFGGSPFVQISAPTSPGNSGGPVVDRAGNVLGVVTMKDIGPGAEGLTFAIRFSRACAVLAAC